MYKASVCQEAKTRKRMKNRGFDATGIPPVDAYESTWIPRMAVGTDRPLRHCVGGNPGLRAIDHDR
jgi:hypothetical protein